MFDRLNDLSAFVKSTLIVSIFMPAFLFWHENKNIEMISKKKVLVIMSIP